MKLCWKYGFVGGMDYGSHKLFWPQFSLFSLHDPENYQLADTTPYLCLFPQNDHIWRPIGKLTTLICNNKEDWLTSQELAAYGVKTD